MKDLAAKAFKFIGASIGVLVAAFTVGYSGATTLYHLFKTERVEAISYVDKTVNETKSEILAIHKADMDGIHGKMDILINQNNLIISQNYRTRKAIESTR